jgi:hypothetical protein
MREKDSYLKYFRRLELSVNNIKLSTPATIKQGEDLRQQLKDMNNEEIYSKKEITNLRQAIDIQTLEFLKQDRGGTIESEALEEQITLNRELENQLELVTKEANESAKILENLRSEKDMILRDTLKGAAKLKVIKNDMSIKDIEIADASKRNVETASRVKEFMALYEFVKNERNKYVFHFLI